jgi:hypothetical protein
MEAGTVGLTHGIADSSSACSLRAPLSCSSRESKSGGAGAAIVPCHHHREGEAQRLHLHPRQFPTRRRISAGRRQHRQ